MFCMYCGKELPNDARFCLACGKPTAVNEMTGRPEQGSKRAVMTSGHEMTIKCPNCGSNLSGLDASCPYCGTQIVGKHASSSVREFVDELTKIDAGTSEGKGVWHALGFDQAMSLAYGDKALRQKLSLISSFPIPNTVEEISEFVILAASSIDVRFGKDTRRNRFYSRPGNTYYSDISLAKAWIGKLKQAYQKAELSFPNDPAFCQIKKIYEDKMSELGLEP